MVWESINRARKRGGLNCPCMIMQQTDVSRGLELSKKSHKLNLNERGGGREAAARESFWGRSGQQTSKDVRGKRSSLPKIATASIITQCIKIDNDISFTWGFFSKKRPQKYSDFVGVLYVLQLLAQYQMMRLFSRILTTVQRWCKTSKKCFCFLAAPRHPLCLSAFSWWYEWTWTQLHTFALLC